MRRERFVLALAGVVPAIYALGHVEADAAAQAGAGVSPGAALERLVSGNGVFVEKMSTHTQTVKERAALGASQAPWASILTCADSRVVPEMIFNVGLGDIFVARVAGNVADTADTASLEYGAAVLGSQLIVVMGHSSCGAVKAAIDAANGKAMPSAALTHLVEQIVPAVKSVQDQPGDEVVNATKANVKAGVRRLSASPILKDQIAHHKLKIVGAYYELSSGKVAWL